MKRLHELLGVSPDLRKLKVDAWFIKKSCVLVKKKIQRSQWPKNGNFVLLMHKVLRSNDDEEVPDSDEDRCYRKIRTIIHVSFSRFINFYFKQ